MRGDDVLYCCRNCDHTCKRSELAAAGEFGKLSCPECGYEFYVRYIPAVKVARELPESKV